MISDELKQKVSGLDVSKAQDVIGQVENLYRTYLLPTSHTYLELDQSEVAKIAEGQSPDCVGLLHFFSRVLFSEHL